MRAGRSALSGRSQATPGKQIVPRILSVCPGVPYASFGFRSFDFSPRSTFGISRFTVLSPSGLHELRSTSQICLESYGLRCAGPWQSAPFHSVPHRDDRMSLGGRMAQDRDGSRLCRLNSALDHDVLVGTHGSISATTTAADVAVTQPAAFNRIAVCVGSAWELPVVERAARLLARRRRSQVLVIHVAINPLTADIFPESTVRRDIESPAEAQALVDEAVRGLRRTGVNASGMVVNEPTASTADQIIRAAAIFHADLVVMCSRGLSDFRGLIQGSVSHQLLSRAPCLILCLPGGLLRFDLRHILVAWDGSPAALSALSVAGRISRVHGASLAAVLVERGGVEPERSGLPARVSLTRVNEGRGGVADTLNEAADAGGADLVVMGSHGRGDLAAMVLGSVTHRLLVISERPILVVRESGRRGAK